MSPLQRLIVTWQVWLRLQVRDQCPGSDGTGVVLGLWIEGFPPLLLPFCCLLSWSGEMTLWEMQYELKELLVGGPANG